MRLLRAGSRYGREEHSPYSTTNRPRNNMKKYPKDITMATRFENGIVVTLGPNNRVIWNGAVVTEGETVVGMAPPPR